MKGLFGSFIVLWLMVFTIACAVLSAAKLFGIF